MSRRVEILDKRWRLVYGKCPARTDGLCDDRSTPNKAITIRPGVRRYPRLWMETLLHEGLHAGLPQLSEDTVEQLAADLTRLLFGEGFTHGE